MPTENSRFRMAVLTGWLLIVVGAAVYARMKFIPAWAAIPIAAALLLELPFYLLPAFSGMLEKLSIWPARGQAAILTLSGVAPWLVYSSLTGVLQWQGLALLLLVAAGVSFWYILLPVSPLVDILFLTLLACTIALKLFDFVYLTPIPKLSLSVLGHIMLIRTGALAVLQFRHLTGDVPSPEYRFWPNRGEWLVGLRYFALLVPVAGTVYWALGLVEWRAHPLSALQAIGTFFGILWVVALSEEFFFRGLLQQWIETWTASGIVALVLASMMFGSVHLGMHNQFPNWRFATVAGIAGLFYGLAWRKTRSVQASMVAHALTVTLWKTFLR